MYAMCFNYFAYVQVISQYIRIFSDSLYMALSGSSLEEVVEPKLRIEWEREKKIWFPSEENYAHDLREPGNLHNHNT